MTDNTKHPLHNKIAILTYDSKAFPKGEIGPDEGSGVVVVGDQRLPLTYTYYETAALESFNDHPACCLCEDCTAMDDNFVCHVHIDEKAFIVEFSTRADDFLASHLHDFEEGGERKVEVMLHQCN